MRVEPQAGHRSNRARVTTEETDCARALSLDHFFELLKKRRIRNRRALRVANRSFASRAQRCYSKGHRNSMIVERVDFCTVQRLGSWNSQAVFAFFNLRSHSPKIGRDRGNPV